MHISPNQAVVSRFQGIKPAEASKTFHAASSPGLLEFNPQQILGKAIQNSVEAFNPFRLFRNYANSFLKTQRMRLVDYLDGRVFAEKAQYKQVGRMLRLFKSYGSFDDIIPELEVKPGNRNR